MMTKLPNASNYDNFAYRISLLRLFVYNGMDNSRQGRKIRKSSVDQLGTSSHGRRISSSRMEVNAKSVHGNNVWESFKKSKKSSVSNNLGASLHY